MFSATTRSAVSTGARSPGPPCSGFHSTFATPTHILSPSTSRSSTSCAVVSPRGRRPSFREFITGDMLKEDAAAAAAPEPAAAPPAGPTQRKQRKTKQAAAPAAAPKPAPAAHQEATNTPPEPSIPHGIHVTIEGNVLIQNSKVNIGYNV